MLTNEYRPKTFGDMAGQELTRSVLEAIVKNPSNSPSTLLFCGAFGCGKTTSARALAYALNPDFKGDLDTSPFYTEYDCSMASAEKMREIKDDFYTAVGKGWKVIVFDECHLMSATAQSALLKVVEEAPKGCKIIFATTDPEKLLNTIRSRSLELRFETVPEEKVVAHLKKVAESANITVGENILKVIAKRSKGHMRNAMMLLDKFQLVGEEQFLNSVKTSHSSILAYMVAILKNDKDSLFKAIDGLMTYPLAEVSTDFKEVLANLMSAIIGDTTQALPYQQLAKSAGQPLKVIIKGMLEAWFMDSFKNDETMRTALLCMFSMVNKNR